MNSPVENVENFAPVTPEDLLALLNDVGITFELHHHRAVFSVGEADEVDAAIPGAHTRNLFLRDKKGNMFLVTLMAHTKIDLNKLAQLLGMGRISFGSPERLMTYLGVTPGSVTPFSIINDQDKKVTLVLDAEMMAQDIINFHPLINTMTVGLKPHDLLRFLEHINVSPNIMDLTPANGE